MSRLTPPPEPPTEEILCPACGHGIDPHGVDPEGPCGVGDESYWICQCRWRPNDIAAELLHAAESQPRITPGEHNHLLKVAQNLVIEEIAIDLDRYSYDSAAQVARDHKKGL